MLEGEGNLIATGNMNGLILEHRYLLNTRVQQPDENIDQFLTALFTLAELCHYGTMRNELIRDRIIAGLSDSRISKKLRLQLNLTLESAITIARDAEASHQVYQDLPLAEEINQTASKSSPDTEEENENLPNDKNADSKSVISECSEFSDFEEIVDPATALESEPSNCAKQDNGDENFAEEDNEDCNLKNSEELQSSAQETITNEKAIADPSNEIKLREATNEEDTFYSRIRHLMKNLTQQNLEDSVNQVKELKINSVEQLQGVAKMLYKKALENPDHAAVCAAMSKELALIPIDDSNGQASGETSNVKFEALIISYCQTEFNKYTRYDRNNVDRRARAMKFGMFVNRHEKKKLRRLMEEDRKIHITAANNVVFIGELFKQGILSPNVIHVCISRLISIMDEGSVKCLYKLLATVGKELEFDFEKLNSHIERILEIIDRKIPHECSLKILLTLEDLIELRTNGWIPKKEISDPATVDEVQEDRYNSDKKPNHHQRNKMSRLARLEMKAKKEAECLAFSTIMEQQWGQESGNTSKRYFVKSLETPSCNSCSEGLSVEEFNQGLHALMSIKNKNSFEKFCTWIATNIAEIMAEI